MKIGWYPDPDDDNARRYWDGGEWSEPLPKPAEPTSPAAPERAATPVVSDRPRIHAPFNPNLPIDEHNPVPDDCAWSACKYPGALPRKPGWGTSVPDKFAAIGTLKGRPLKEIESFVGLPQSWTSVNETVRHLMQQYNA